MRMRAGDPNAFVIGTLVPCFHLFEPSFRDDSNRLSRMLRRLHICGRDVICRKIATDHPPADPLRSSDALNCPNRCVRGNVPCGPIADPAMLHLLGTKVIRDNGSLLLAPAFLNVRIIVVWRVHIGVDRWRSNEVRRAGCAGRHDTAAGRSASSCVLRQRPLCERCGRHSRPYLTCGPVGILAGQRIRRFIHHRL